MRSKYEKLITQINHDVTDTLLFGQSLELNGKGGGKVNSLKRINLFIALPDSGLSALVESAPLLTSLKVVVARVALTRHLAQ